MSVHIELATVREQAERLAVLEPLVPILKELLRLSGRFEKCIKTGSMLGTVEWEREDMCHCERCDDFIGKLTTAQESAAWESARAALKRLEK